MRSTGHSDLQLEAIPVCSGCGGPAALLLIDELVLVGPLEGVAVVFAVDSPVQMK